MLEKRAQTNDREGFKSPHLRVSKKDMSEIKK